MMNIMRFRIKINSKSTRVLLKDDDDWKRTTADSETSHSRSFSPLVSHLSHHFSRYTALSLQLKCYLVSGHAHGLLCVISGLLAGGALVSA